MYEKEIFFFKNKILEIITIFHLFFLKSGSTLKQNVMEETRDSEVFSGALPVRIIIFRLNGDKLPMINSGYFF
jgi:hypothetical protein